MLRIWYHIYLVNTTFAYIEQPGIVVARCKIIKQKPHPALGVVLWKYYENWPCNNNTPVDINGPWFAAATRWAADAHANQCELLIMHIAYPLQMPHQISAVNIWVGWYEDSAAIICLCWMHVCLSIWDKGGLSGGFTARRFNYVEDLHRVTSTDIFVINCAIDTIQIYWVCFTN